LNQAVREKQATVDDCWNKVGVWSQTRASCPELKQVIHCRNCRHYSTAGRSLLERSVPGDYREEWTARLAQTRQGRQSTSNAALLFRLGDEWLGLHCRHVQEVTEMRLIHSLPHKTSTLIKGLVNLRGELRLCVSIGSLLQIEKAQDIYQVNREIHERMIHIRNQGQSFVFPVSEVHGIYRYPDQALKPTPSTLSKSRHSFTTGVLAWNDQHVGILDYELLFYALSTGLQ